MDDSKIPLAFVSQERAQCACIQIVDRESSIVNNQRFALNDVPFTAY